MGELYKIDFPNGKSYIGISITTAEKRFRRHLAAARDGATVVGRAIAAHGARNVTVVVLDRCENWDVLCNLERWAIARYETLAPGGYNISSGGDGPRGVKRSDANKARCSAATKRAMSRPDVKERHRAAMNRPDVAARIGAASKERTRGRGWGGRGVRRGWHCTESHRANLSASLQAYWSRKRNEK